MTDETTKRMAPVQVTRGEPFPRSIPWHFHERAWSEYAAHHHGQSAERIAERGGFGVSEVVACTRPPSMDHRTEQGAATMIAWTLAAAWYGMRRAASDFDHRHRPLAASRACRLRQSQPPR